MSHVNLARKLKLSNFLRNIFGASPFFIDPTAATPEAMVYFTELSQGLPIITFVACLFILGLGFYIQLGLNRAQTEIPGFDMQLGSLNMIIMQLTILVALLNYIVTMYITLTRRREFRQCLVTMFEICRTLDEKYGIKYNPKELALGINSALIFMPGFYFVYIFVFEGFTFNGKESFYLIPISFMIQNMTASLTAIDIVCFVHKLGDFIGLLGEVPAHRRDAEFFLTFTRTLDLFSVINENHGNREFYSIGNEFFVILTQFFYTCYGIANSSEQVAAASLYMALGGVIPRVLKVLYICQRGVIVDEALKSTVKRIRDDIRDPDILNNFNMHLLHFEKEFKITAKYIFPINNRLIYGIIGTGCSYFLVLIQFQFTESVPSEVARK